MVANVCFTIKLRPGSEAEYQRRHDKVWPELIAAIRAAGIREYVLFRRGDDVFAFAECDPDGPTAFRKLAATAVDRDWSLWMSDLIEDETDEHGDLRFAHQVWRLQPRGSGSADREPEPPMGNAAQQ